MRDLVDNLQREVINNPGNHVATGTLGRVFIELHQYPEALDYLREAIRLQPNESEYYFSLSNALACSGRLEESLGACQRAVELNPDFMEATAGLANLYAWNFDR
jgi:tetratricopeptide (TPR) repeat protein